MSGDKLFTLRINLHDIFVTIHAFDGQHQDPITGHSRIDVEVKVSGFPHVSKTDQRRQTRTVFKRGDTWCAVNRWTSIDGQSAKELVLSLVAMKPGDTDPDYFACYTQEQLDFANKYGEELSMVTYDRYGEP